MAKYLDITFNNFDIPDSIRVAASRRASETGIGLDRGVYLLKDDPTIEVESTYQTIGDLFSLAADIQGLVSVINSASGTVSNNLNNIFNAQMWKETSPLRIQTKIVLYSKGNATIDVMYEAYRLASQTIITDHKSIDGSTFYKIPGLSLGELSRRSRAGAFQTGTELGNVPKDAKKELTAAEKALQQNADKIAGRTKYISFSIPGIVEVSDAIVRSAKPTFSKQEDSQGASIWAEVDLQIESIEPARTSFFAESFFRASLGV